MPSKSPPDKSSRKVLINVLKWLVAIVLLSYLFWKNRDGIREAQTRQILWGMFAAALVVRFLSLLATFSRWQLLVRGIGLPFTFRESFRLGILGEACNLMGPGAVGGDLIKAGLLAKDHRDRIASVMATVFLDRILGMWALFVLGAFASLSPTAIKLTPELQWTVWALWGGSVAGLIGIGLMFIPAFTHSRLMHWITTWKFVGRIVKELMDSIQMYQGRPLVIVGAALWAIAGHFGFLSAIYFGARSLNNGQLIPGYLDHISGLPLPEALSAAFPSPGGLGVLESAVDWFYQQFQLSLNADSTPKELAQAGLNGVLTVVAYRLTQLAWAAVGVVYYMSSRAEIQQAVQSVDQEKGEADKDSVSLPMGSQSPAA